MGFQTLSRWNGHPCHSVHWGATAVELSWELGACVWVLGACWPLPQVERVRLPRRCSLEPLLAGMGLVDALQLQPSWDEPSSRIQVSVALAGRSPPGEPVQRPCSSWEPEQELLGTAPAPGGQQTSQS